MIDIADAATEFADYVAMIKERQPEMAEALDARVAEVVAEMEDLFKPYTDLAEGKITLEEFAVIVAQRAEADLEARIAKYGDEGPWDFNCEECGTLRTIEDEDDDPPHLYPTCEDIDGVSCVEPDDEDEID